MPEDISRERVERLQADGAALVEVLPLLVSTADGRLVGVLRREDVERARQAERLGGPVLANE